jgi:hypothetical protein
VVERSDLDSTTPAPCYNCSEMTWGYACGFCYRDKESVLRLICMGCVDEHWLKEHACLFMQWLNGFGV